MPTLDYQEAIAEGHSDADIQAYLKSHPDVTLSGGDISGPAEAAPAPKAGYSGRPDLPVEETLLNQIQHALELGTTIAGGARLASVGAKLGTRLLLGRLAAGGAESPQTLGALARLFNANRGKMATALAKYALHRAPGAAEAELVGSLAKAAAPVAEAAAPAAEAAAAESQAGTLAKAAKTAIRRSRSLRGAGVDVPLPESWRAENIRQAFQSGKAVSAADRQWLLDYLQRIQGGVK